MTELRTIAFVDLAGFTALTEVHGDDAAVDLLDTFTAAARDAVAHTGAELVKTIGDAVMLAAPDPRSGLLAVEQVFEAAYATDAFPEPAPGCTTAPSSSATATTSAPP
jgi:adenylate cyclase